METNDIKIEGNIHLEVTEAIVLAKELKERIRQIEHLEDGLLIEKFQLLKKMIEPDKKFTAGNEVKFLGMSVKSNSQVGEDLKKTGLQINDIDLKILDYERTMRINHDLLSKIRSEFNWDYMNEKHTPILERNNYKLKCNSFLYAAGFTSNPTMQELYDQRIYYTYITPYLTEIIERQLKIPHLRINLLGTYID